MASSLVALIEGLGEEEASELYSSRWACRAVLHSLPPLAKQYALRLLHVCQPVPQAVLAGWTAHGAEKAHVHALSRLLALRVLLRSQKASESVELHPRFQSELLQSIHSSHSHSDSSHTPSHLSVHLPQNDSLHEHARARWDDVLLQLLPDSCSAVSRNHKPRQYSHGLSDSTGGWLDPTALFRIAGFLSNDNRISPQGFKFLMSGTASQLWRLMREHVAEAQRSGSTGVAIVAFALRLAFQQQGQPYRLDRSRSLETQAAADFARMGLVYVLHEDNDGIWYVPTELASTLLAGETAAEGSGSPQGSILVETNMRVYAYTQSPVQLSILKMISKQDAVLPNLYIGSITRAKIRSALLSVSAEQIVSFLTLHAHAQVAKKRFPVPERISDQIHLWEQEMNRMSFMHVAMYTEFKTREMFDRVVSQVRENNALLWCTQIGSTYAEHTSTEANGHADAANAEVTRDSVFAYQQAGTLKLVCPIGSKEEVDKIIKAERKREKKREKNGL